MKLWRYCNSLEFLGRGDWGLDLIKAKDLLLEDGYTKCDGYIHSLEEGKQPGCSEDETSAVLKKS